MKEIYPNSNDYPPLLQEIPDPPQTLFIESCLNLKALFKRKAIAVVGSRDMTEYGKEVTIQFTKELVKKGFIIVSGLAYGVDHTAHQTALSQNGLTIAVLGSGLDRIYPAVYKETAKEIIKHGALITEFPLGSRIYPSHFLQRNRIVSGLSVGVLVTEAAERSGTLNIARLAGEQGREVFAVPGPITSRNSKGVINLIKNGATPVQSVYDILEELEY